MAKRRQKVNQRPDPSPADRAVDRSSGARSISLPSLACAMLAGLMVYVAYEPGDSVLVEQGDGLQTSALALVIAVAASLVGWTSREPVSMTAPSTGPVRHWHSRILDWSPWLLAGWVMLAAWATCPPGNLRMATNEAWIWVAGAAMVVSLRRLLAEPQVRKPLLILLVVCSSGLAIHGLHQNFISLPSDRADFLADPDRVLEIAGIDAPEGSAERMVFSNRLRDGGPTATFALANSLAAVLVPAFIIALAALIYRWRRFTGTERLGWIIVATLCIGCIVAARSRSATGAAFLGAAVLPIVILGRQEISRRALALGTLCVVAVGGLTGLLIVIFGNREWIESALPSVQVRLQYWRSTLRMVAERPWFGAGPGNFQSIYERYREPETVEQVAEPHNFFFETLAVGGVPALTLLIVLVAAGVWWTVNRVAVSGDDVSGDLSEESQDASLTDSSSLGSWIWLGAAVSLGLIWLLGWISFSLPDLGASLYVVPACLAIAWTLHRSLRDFPAWVIDRIVVVALAMLLLHLGVAGGWTVPGIAVVVWVLGGMLLSLEPPQQHDGQFQPKLSRPAYSCFLVVLLLGIYFVSIRPVENTRRQLTIAEAALERGQLGRARSALETAAESDRWSPTATIWLAGLDQSVLANGRDDPALRRRWERLLEQSKQRAGDDPAVYRAIGAQQIHLYQCLGNPADLEAAAETFADLLEWSPSNQWAFAQMAVIADAIGQPDRSEAFLSRAVALAETGELIERTLPFQHVFIAQPLGRGAAPAAVRRPVDAVLSEPASKSYRNSVEDAR